MIKLIRLFGLFVIICLIYEVGSAFNGNSVSKEIEKENVVEEYVEFSFSDSDDIVLDEQFEESSELDDTLPVEDFNEVENSDVAIEIIEATKQEDSKNSQNTVKIDEKKSNSEESKQQYTEIVDKNYQKENESTEVVEEVKIWDELGITEYDYYNSPMWSWQKVTHSSFKECELAGKDATRIKVNPETLEEYQDYEQFWCYGVNSYSGKFLGAMLKLM